MAEEAAVAVCVRVRPLSSREIELGEATQVYWKTDSNAIYQVDGSKSFNFDRVFHNNETTKNVYEEIAVPIIDSAIQGYNGTIFAYGQTASGKTHTMMGSEDCLGVIPRAIHDIFQKIKKFPDREFLLRVSYMEIYNETITDLLCNAQKMKPLIIREDINRNVYVADLTEEVVYTSEMALNWITKGEKNRHYGITKMNQRSSRSHTIFRMILESREKGEPSSCEGSIKVSHLNLVDLAGSERAAQTGAEGVRLKEGCNINRSLFILGQVIKKLSDGQIGGFINYRDSKLTRILQNSLGGNAKTRIICTVTPASFDETLTTLQFASTAKYMKNTPYVNEVSSDEALLKRYRKEIVDLKKQLEEVNIKTRAQEMEKDQLAQLLDEKDLLQKVQDEKIHNLTRMLVTSSSLTSQQEFKAKRKRRVTWCFGKINKMKDSNYVKEFSMPMTVTTRASRSAITPLGEIDESFCLESDTFSNTPDTLTEIEWNSATKLLNEENLESEFNSLRAKYDNLVLDYEQLRRENEEMGLKLKEKNDLDEFEALERKTEKDQENELSSKVELLREKEAEIKNLQQCIDSQKSKNSPSDSAFLSENSDDLKQMKQSLFDAETVALDAKRESAFLRSENLELKEKMKELANTCKQMEIDTQLYQGQLEAKKKIQVDLEKELQSAFNEITNLTSLVDGKLPKDLLCNSELERRITDLQEELNKEVKENEALQKEINSLSELKSLPPEVEMLRKEIQDKSEELCMVTSERDRLSSDVSEKDSRIQGLLEEVGRTKEDLATAQLNYQSTEQELQDFKILHMELEQKCKTVQEENEKMNQEVGSLSREAETLRLSLDTVKTELSRNTPELQQKTAESQERLREVEQLKDELERRDAWLRATEEEKALVTERLQHTLEEVRSLAQEKEALSQLRDSLQAEQKQLRSDIQDTVSMNIDTQEQLRKALESLKQHQETINTLKMRISKETSSNLHAEEKDRETEHEFHQKMVGLNVKQDLEAETTGTLLADVMDSEVAELQRKICSLVQEKNELQQMLESIKAEKEQLKTDLKENIEMTIENQEELRILGDELKKQQEIVAQEKNHAIEKDKELARTCERLAEVDGNLKEKNDQLQEKEQQLLNAQKEMSEMQKKVNEMETLQSELKNQKVRMEHMETERLELAQKLHENHEDVKSLTKERNDLKELQASFEIERDQLKEHISKIEAAVLQKQEELRITYSNLKEHQETINELRQLVSEKTDEVSNIKMNLENSNAELQDKIRKLNKTNEHLLLKLKEDVSETQKQLKDQSLTLNKMEMENLNLAQKLHQNLEEMKSVAKERDHLRSVEDALKLEREQLREVLQKATAKDLEAQQELKIAQKHLKEQEETIEKLRERLSEKATQISNMQKSLDQSKHELQEKDCWPCWEAVDSGRRSPSGGEQPLLGSLKEKCLRIGELLKRYSEMGNQYECLNGLCLDLEKELELREELSMRVKANLSLPYPEARQFQKLLATNLNRSMEFQRVIKKLKNELSYAAEMKEEEHGSINNFEMALIDEMEKQGELHIKIRHLQQKDEGPSSESRHCKLNKLLDMHIEEILKDFSGNDFPSIKIELQQILNNRKKMIQFLEEWLNTHFDIEKLKNGLQKEYKSICQVNNFYNDKITAMINESLEFEERNAARRKEWEQYLESAREESRALLKDCQVLDASPASSACGDPAAGASRSLQITPGAVPLATQKIQELETSLREAKESAVHKEDKIIKMQKELEMSRDVIVKLQAKVNESTKFLEKSNEMIQALQDKAALGANPYKEQIEDLKTKLVKLDLEKKQTAKEFEKEIASTRATVEHQDEVIRRLKENLRRNQQAQDTSMIMASGDTQPPQNPLTCGGGSGIVQSTKALILKSGYLRLEKELASLKQQKEQLEQQKRELLSTNQQLSDEVRAWKERTLKREAPQELPWENLPNSPARVPGTPKKRPDLPAQCGGHITQAPAPKDSPKARFFDPRSKSFPGPRPVRYFDNSSLGLCPEEQAVGTENMEPRVLPSTSLRDAPECRMQ